LFIYLHESSSKMKPLFQRITSNPYQSAKNQPDPFCPSQGKILYAGEPGMSGFFMTESSFATTGADAQMIFEGLQVGARAGTYRPALGVYQVIGDTEGAVSSALANPQFGAGKLEQVFLENWQTKVIKIDEIKLINTNARVWTPPASKSPPPPPPPA
jgi:hypothetical protein